MYKKILLLSVMVFCLFFMYSCTPSQSHLFSDLISERVPESEVFSDTVGSEAFSPIDISTQGSKNCIDPSGNTLESRILTPIGYSRSPAEKDSLTTFLRSYPVKEHGSPLLLYDGTAKEDQLSHAAIFSLPLEAEDFQQCADSVMRIYAEFYRSIGQAEKIRFHFTNGFAAEYMRWLEGYRIEVCEGEFRWIKSAEYDDSYENFTRYMRIVFAYANTYSMDTYEAKSISMHDIQVGDIWLEGGHPGHAMMVVDICHDENGRKAFLLAQGHMPAQEFEVMKNPRHEEDPWYYEEEITYPFLTDVHEFKEGSLQRLNYFP